MKRLVLGFVGFALVASAAADQFATATLRDSWQPGQSGGGIAAVDPNAFYSNITNYTAFVVFNGGAGADPAAPANTITRLLADDLTPNAFAAANGAQPMTQMIFSVGNLNAVAVTARPRLRIYDDNGVGGGPGTALGGFSFNPITFAANSANTYFFNPGGTLATLGMNSRHWVGITFDNNSGGTGATAAQLNNLGPLTFNPADVGSSADLDFLTTAQGSHLVNNPPGSQRTSPFGGNPVASYGYEESAAPEPVSMVLLGLGGLVIARRRR